MVNTLAMTDVGKGMNALTRFDNFRRGFVSILLEVLHKQTAKFGHFILEVRLTRP